MFTLTLQQNITHWKYKLIQEEEGEETLFRLRNSDSEIFIRHLNHTIQQNAIKNNTNRKKHVWRLPLRHCYVASMGATKLDT